MTLKIIKQNNKKKLYVKKNNKRLEKLISLNKK